MTLLPCSPCCKGCIECSDAPKTAIVTLSYPGGSGTTIAGDTEDPPGWTDVTTQCRPDPEIVGVRSFLITNSGDEYHTAPTVKLLGGGGTDAGVYCEITSPVASFQITNGGAGYTSNPTVSFPYTNVTAAPHRAAKAYAVVTGGVTSITVTARGRDYTEPPVVGVSDGYGDFFKGIAVLTQYIKQVEVTEGGNGYTSTPSVVVGGSGSGAFLVARRATAASAITVTSGGSGYTEPPTVTCLGATLRANIQNGSVVSVDVLDEGEGAISQFALTSANVVFSGGGGSGAAATATLRNKIVRVDIFPGFAGTDFDSPPPISFVGGGGSGAAAVATVMGKHVQSVTIQESGDGYRFNPTVTFTGDGTGAAATAQVTGSVSDLIFTDSGKYIQRSYSLNGVIEFISSWPIVAFSGGGGSGAAATLSFSGKVTDLYVPAGNSGTGFSSPPTVSIVGGGGRGAAAIASIRWQQENVFRFPLGKEECLLRREEHTTAGLPYATEAEVPPDAGTIRPDGWGEVAYWAVEVQTAAAPRTFGVSGIGQVPEQFANEMLAASVLKSWHTTLRNGTKFVFSDPHDSDLRYYIRRFYSRVPPQGKYRVTTDAAHYQTKLAASTTILHYGFSANSVEPAVFLPAFEQQDDAKGEPYWRVVSVALASGGSNLAVPKSGLVRIESFDGNIVGSGLSGESAFDVEVTATFTPPTVNGYRITGFKNGPVVDFTFAPATDEGDYVLSGASLVSGGEEIWPSTRTAYIEITSLGSGYYEATALSGYSLPRLLATIQGGTVTSIAIDRPGLIRGPAVITSATIIEDEPDEGEEPEDIRPMVVGASGFKTTEEYSAPESISATAEGGSPDATFSVTIAQDTDQNGKPFWRVSEVGVTTPGDEYQADPAILFEVAAVDTETYSIPASVTASASGGSPDATFSVTIVQDADESGNAFWRVSEVGLATPGDDYQEDPEILFSVAAGDTELAAASAIGKRARQEPTLVASPAGGSGAALSVAYAKVGDDHWEITGVSVQSGGQGYSTGDAVSFQLGQDDVEVTPATASVSMTAAGAIQSVSVTSGGSYYKQLKHLDSVELQSGGQYARINTVAIKADIESVAASATGRRARQQPTLTASSLYGFDASLSISYEKVGEDHWKVSSVSVQSGGQGYATGDLVFFQLGEDDVEEDPASGVITTVPVDPEQEDAGVIQSVSVTNGGLYYKLMKYLGRVDIHSGGKYFRREITATEQPLDPPECIGVITDDWEEVRARPPEYDTIYPNPIAVGETFTEFGETAPPVEYERTRICPHPEISVRLE